MSTDDTTTPETATTSAEPTAPSQEARLQQAGKALAARLGLGADAAETPAAPPADQQPSEPKPDAPEPEGAPEQPTDEQIIARERKPGSAAWIKAMYRQRLGALEKRVADLDGREKDLQERSARVAELDRLAQLMREDPEGAVDLLAKRAGLTGAQYYERLTRRRLQEHGRAAPEEALERVRDLEARLQTAEQANAEQAKRAQEQQTAAQHEAFIGQTVQHFLAIGEDAQLGAAYPNLALLPPGRLEREVRGALEWAVQHRPETTLPELAKALDTMAAEEYSHIEAARSKRRPVDPGNPAQAKPETASGPPVDSTSAKPGSAQARSGTGISNRTAAEAGAARRDMSREERLRAAGKVLAPIVRSD